MSKKILVIEDDIANATVIKGGLALKGYKVTVAPSAEDALKILQNSLPNLIVLDINLRGLSGIQLCEILKKNPRTAPIPIIMLTVENRESQKVGALELGADDYMTKPFSEKELAARVKALIRRASGDGKTQRMLSTEGLEVNLDTRTAVLTGKRLELSQIEFDLLSLFLDKKEIVHSYAGLAEIVWGDDRLATSHTIAVAISRLRDKLGRLGRKIESVPGRLQVL